MKNKKIFITGGAGFLGEALVKKYIQENDITVFSRDEAKHYYLKKKFPKVKTIIGDIRNFDLLKRSSNGHQIGIYAASLKQIEAVDQNVEEAIEVIIRGAINSRRAAEECGFESACFISSDKSRSATTLYGSMKFVAGESFIMNSEESGVKLSTAIYGNVMNSTGSIIPLIWRALRDNIELTLYSENMTRFMIEIDEAITLIEKSLAVSGYNVIPNLKSFRVKDLFEIYKEKFGLRYNLGVPRISEKIHETLISKEEAPRTHFSDSYYMHYKNISNNPIGIEEFSSNIVVLPKEKLLEHLLMNNFYQPDFKS